MAADSPKRFALSQIKEAPKRPLWGLSCRKCLQFETVFPCAVLPAQEGAFAGPSCPPRETPFCGPWSSGGSVKVSARLGPSPGGPSQQQHPGPHPGVGEGDWKHWRRSRMWMPHQSEQRPCQGRTPAFRRTPQNKEGLNTTSEYQQGHLAPQLRPTLPPLCQGLPP